MMRIWFVISLLVIGTLSQTAFAGGGGEDLCRSATFREAFLDGQEGVLIDDTSPSTDLVLLGDNAVPCLTVIARDGGDALGISGCLETTEHCRSWALTALRLIGTPAARDALRAYSETANSTRLRGLAIRALGSLRDEASRPLFLESLEASEPEIRAEVLVALGLQRLEKDRGVLAKAFARMPDEVLYRAFHGLRLYGDATLEPGVIARIEKIQDAENRAALERAVAAWKRDRDQEQALLDRISNPVDADALFLTMRDVGRPSAAVAASAERRLAHADARVRAGAVALLARFPERSVGVGELLTVTERLPDHYVAIAARDLLRIPDPTVVVRLTARAERMENAARRTELERILKQHESPQHKH